MRTTGSPARRRVWQLLPEPAKAAAGLGAGAQPLGEQPKGALIEGLNALIPSRGLYRQEDFRGVQIPQDIAELLKRGYDSLPDKEVRRANRAVLAAAYGQRTGQEGKAIHLIPPLGRKVSPTRGAEMIAAGVGTFFGRIVFCFGILGMVLSTITLHMLVCGFAACEVFGVEPSAGSTAWPACCRRRGSSAWCSGSTCRGGSPSGHPPSPAS